MEAPLPVGEEFCCNAAGDKAAGIAAADALGRTEAHTAIASATIVLNGTDPSGD